MCRFKMPHSFSSQMLCEERGFFLEIADIIRGFGLTILKGVMEICDSKIWARFLVEVGAQKRKLSAKMLRSFYRCFSIREIALISLQANRGVTRMDIFLSLVQLLQQTSSARSSSQPAKVIDKGTPTFTNYQQSPVSIPISLEDRLH